MRSTSTQIKRITLLALAALFVFTGQRAWAGTIVAPGQKLFIIKTEHFDIIFPKKSEPSALRLASIAEEVYAESAGKLEASLPTRIPVVITPDIEVFNGVTNLLPYVYIVLYDTALDLGWTSFKDNFRGLFLHELTHALSLQIKAPWASFLSGIFGSWVAPAFINAPEFMVEGVTVSFESGDGVGGRANDPLVRERVRQDIIENRFKSPLECEGVYDEYPNGDLYYEYGGLFNLYIQKTYGMEKYDELWKGMGGVILSLSLDPYKTGFFKVFEKVYGTSFLKAWADFRLSLCIGDILDPPEILSPSDPATIGGLVGGGGSLFWADARSQRAYRMDAASGQRSMLFSTGPNDAISDASADGRRLLLTRTLELPDGRYSIETAVYDPATDRFQSGEEMRDLRAARFFRDGLVGIRPNLHNTDLIYVSRNGSKLLLSGSDRVMFSSPAVLDDSRIALVVAVEGRRSIGILDVDAGSLKLIRPRGAEGEHLLDFVRQVSASKGRLYFSFDSDDRMYKLGVYDGERLELETRDYSGGVLMPVEQGGRVYYVARFSEGSRICRYPGEAESLGPRVLEAGLEDFDPSAIREEIEAETSRTEATVLPYRPLAYARPSWIVYPDFNTLFGRSTRVFGSFYFQDPIQANTELLVAGYDSSYPFADLGLEWVNSSLPVSFDTKVGDKLVYGASGPPERQSSGSIQASLMLPAFPMPRYAAIGLGGTLLYRASGSEGSPYTWRYEGPSLAASGIVGWFGRLPGAAKSTSRGIDLVSYHDYDTGSSTYKTEAHAAVAIDSLPLRLDLWGAWANESILSLDSTSTVFSSDWRPAYYEYATIREGSSSLLAEGNASCRLADQAIHSSVLGLYLNRLLIDLGYRGAYFIDEYLQSCYARLSLDLAVGVGGLGGLGIRTFAEGFVRLSETSGSSAFGWRLGIQTSADAGTPSRRATRVWPGRDWE